MDNRRLLYAISISLVILVIFQVLGGYFLPKPPPKPIVAHSTVSHTMAPASGAASSGATPGVPGEATTAAASAPRLKIDAPAIKGSMSLLGARLDDLVLTNYHQTVSKKSPLVQLLSRPGGKKSYYVQFGWDAAPGSALAVPGPQTLWTSSGGALSPNHPVTLSWNNGAGVTFELLMTVDTEYMVTVQQRVVNAGKTAVAVFPWSRIRRDYLPTVEGSFTLHKGPIGAFKGTLHEMSYDGVKSGGKHPLAGEAPGTAFQDTNLGGWAGITGKYWLTALIPSQGTEMTGAYRYLERPGDPKQGAWQVDYMTAKAIDAAPGATAGTTLHVFAGAKVLSILNGYEAKYHIPLFERAIDFGWFFFLTKPIFEALDYLASVFGNYGVAIIVFTVMLKLVLFPLVRTSYRSMGRMRAVAPKVAAIRERLKDDTVQQQKEIMALYKSEGVNPAAGCLPMLPQIPIFFSLYKVIFISIGMRHAPFVLWIHDLAAEDPTNVFNLFGLIPYHPSRLSPFLHLGVLPIIMGLTMWGQQKLNPPPPDPTQAKMMQFMPVIFTFMLGRFAAGLVLYYCVNNSLTILQQWFIMRGVTRPPRRQVDVKA
ncbi:membrane protein insertase YidC [Acidiphilium sp. PA]|uniref:membrane protein insertase YidC n=1 Tax=Acidiphilium sp. PA TaxID=2871705 RepID=UPI0022433D8C|nr:membrane protein insertase YidC [Acidiphilium sp. PA]MCW8307663.1 membrane protein insertase YidC [Acidiphilium sp. PA]